MAVGKPKRQYAYKKKSNGSNDTGRPTSYKPEYCQAIIDFFSIPIKTGDVVNDIPLFQDFAHEIGVSRETLHEWKRRHPNFSDAYKKARELQESWWIRGSMKGLFNPAFTIFFGKNVFRWTDRVQTDVEVSQSENKPLKWQVEVVKSDAKDD